MAEQHAEQFLISIQDGETEMQLLADCELVEMLNSNDQKTKATAFELIKKLQSTTEDTSYGCMDYLLCNSGGSCADTCDKIKVWTEKDTNALFDIRRQKENDFNSVKVHKSLWDNISKELFALGVTASSTQCSNKQKAMKREYKKKTVDNNSQTGAEKKSCPFYEEFSELFGHKSGTRPAFVMSHDQ